MSKCLPKYSFGQTLQMWVIIGGTGQCPGAKCIRNTLENRFTDSNSNSTAFIILIFCSFFYCFCLLFRCQKIAGNSMNASLLQTSLLGETPSHVLETSGSSLPVHVVESLLTLQSTKSAGWPVVLSQTWGWLVVRSRLLVFQHGQQRSSKTCFSLELPNSILLHQANLCYVGESSPAPSCVVVSPMGVVR